MTVVTQQGTSQGAAELRALRLITSRIDQGAPTPGSVLVFAAGQAGPLVTIALDLADLDAITTWAALLTDPTDPVRRVTVEQYAGSVLHYVDVYLDDVRVYLTARTPIVPSTAALWAEALIES